MDPATRIPRKQLLIVDDEELVLRSVARAVEREYDVTRMSSATEALRLAESGRCWDLVLSDVTMPAMTGVEFARRLVQVCPGLRGRVALMSGGVFSPQVAAFVERCGLQIIWKPFHAKELLAVLANIDGSRL